MLKKRLKPIYFLFLTIPLVYCLLWHFRTVVPSIDSKTNDYFYTSVKTSKSAVVNLIANKTLLSSMNLNSAGYKNLQFVGQVNDSAGLKITVNNLSTNDTISFLGFNLYRNNQVFSLCNSANKNYTAENAIIIEKNGILNAIVQQSGKPVTINLKPLSAWESVGNNHHFYMLIFLCFIFSFLLLLAIAPPSRYFIASVAFSVLILFVCYLADIHSIGRVTVTSSSPVNRGEIYYNYNPFFTPLKKFSTEGKANAFSTRINIETDGFLRCDVGDTIAELNDFRIKIKSGIFGSSFNVASIPQRELVLNDLVLRGNNYYITGNDPYFALTSTYFIKNIKWLIFLEHNIFLFITLAFFVLLLGIHRFVGGVDKILNKVKFKVAYFSFLLIPFSYFLIIHFWQKEVPTKSPDQIYFSVRTSKHSVINLINANDSIASWSLNSPAFKYFQYSGKLNVNAPISLKFKNLSANDTISLLSINLFHDDHVYSLFAKNKPACNLKNAHLLDKSGEIIAIVEKANEPVVVNLLPFSMMTKDHPKHGLETIIIIIFFISFIIVLIKAPRSGYFIASCIISSLLMFVYFWTCNNGECQVIMSTNTPIKSGQVFFNNNPDFLPSKKYDAVSKTNVLKSQVDLVAYNYLRCDIEDTIKKLDNVSIKTKAGMLMNIWDYSAMSPENIMMNDMIKRGSTFYVLGNDPFFVLSTARQIQSITRLMFLRQNIFFLLSIIFFIFLVFMHKMAKKLNMTTFFFVLIFLVLISFGFILRLFFSDSLILTAELRYASNCPAFKRDSSDVFLQRFDNYLKDQIPGRSNIIIMNNLLEYRIFGQLLNNPNVHFGKDGWMFYIGGKCKENYETRNPLTQEDLKKMTAVLLARRDWLRERGIQFYFMFPPMAYFVYEDEVGPRLWRYHKKSKVDQLYEYIKSNTDLNFIDVTTPLKEARKTSKEDLYFRNNSHWNYHGSYVAYVTLINYIKRDFPDLPAPIPLKDITWVDFDNYVTDLYQVIALDKYYTSQEYQPSIKEMLANVETSYPTYPGFSSAAPPFLLVNKHIPRPSMLIYGDSYSGFLSYYLANNFNRNIFLWTPIFYPSIIEKEKPDIVIQEMNDYSIYNILYPNPPLPAKKDTLSGKAD